MRVSNSPKPPDLLTLRDAARLIGVHENTIRNWVSRGLLNPVRVPGKRYQRFDVDEIDRVAHQQQVSSEKARRTEGTSELVDADYLDSWANSRDAEELLPAVVARLLEGTPDVLGVHVRTGDGIRLRGWDGLVETGAGNAWVPTGPSAWELGTSRDPRRKADADYASRTAKPLEVEPSVTTFVFVTPRRWPGARKWEQARRMEGAWRDVRVLDADDLAGWLRSQPATHLWFSEIVGLQPLEVKTLGNWWNRFRRQTDPPIPAELLLAGRSASVGRLLERIQSATPSAIFVRGASRDDATAFVAAALEKSDALSKDALIATSLQGWERLSVSSPPSLLIPLLEEPPTASAIGMGHTVIVPLGSNSTTFRGEVIDLGLLDRAAARDILAREPSLTFEQADRLAGLARRSLASFLRAPELAAFPRSRPPWAQAGQARLLASLALVGGWTDAEADQHEVAQLVGRGWRAIEDELISLSDSSDPPFVRTGAGWQVVSPDGAWELLHHTVQSADVQRFCERAIQILGEPDPTLVLDAEERLLANVRGIKRAHSATLSRGVAQGLALLGAFEGEVGDGARGADFARDSVRRLLDRANDDNSGLTWRSMSAYLQLLAEAAPNEFLDAVAAGLSGDKPVLAKMFTDGGGATFLETSSEHTGLLWALELLCWPPQYLSRAAGALARLTELDPGGRLSNRPDRSLRAVFLPWMPQTTAPLGSRYQVLDTLRARFPEVAWNLEMALLPSSHDVSSFTPRPRFQQWPTTDERAPLSEWLEAIAETTTRVIDDAGQKPWRWSQLVVHVADMPPQQREQLVRALADLEPASMDSESRAELWEKLAAMISRHREFPDARWSLADEALKPLEAIAEKLKPDDLVGRFAPLFDWHPPLPTARRDDFEAWERAVTTARADAVRQILASLGFSGIERLARASKLPEHVGTSTAEVAPGVHFADIRNLLGRTDETRRFAHGWVARMASDADWFDAIADEVGGWSPATQLGFLIAVGQPTPRVLALIDSLQGPIQRRYWETVRPVNVDDESLRAVVDRLLKYERPWIALDLLSLACHRPSRRQSGALSQELVVSVLDRCLQSEAVDPAAASGAAYEIAQTLDYLESIGVETSTLARYEWSFFRILEHTRPARALYRGLADDPGFFVELVCRVYRPKNAPSVAEINEQSVAIAQNAWSVLNAWRPQLDAPGGIEARTLRSWIDRARTGLADNDRGDVGDHQIGQTLSGTAPGGDGIWPGPELRELIEELGNTNIESGLAVGVVNSRGVTSRGVYDGGAQEWVLAAKYREWAEALAARWPRTGRLLTGLADDFERAARREDLEAQTLANRP